MSGNSRRWIGLGALVASSVVLVGSQVVAAAAPQQEPVFLSIGGGAVDSAAYKWSSGLALVLSRPPGLPKCDAGTACGVPDVVAGAQTYDEQDALLKALMDGRVTTGILSALSIYNARCTPAKGQTTPAILALRNLYRQPVQFVLPANSAIRTPKDLAGKTLVVGEHGSDSEIVAFAMLEAYGVPRAKVKLIRLKNNLGIAAMKSGLAQAGLFVGHAVDTALGDLIGQGGYTLLSIPDSPERRKLLHALPVFDAGAIPPGTYPSLPPTSTLDEQAVWAASPTLDQALAEKLVTAISEPHNLSRLSELVEPVGAVPESEAFLRLPTPLAEGAARVAAAANQATGVIDCPAPAPTALKEARPTQ